jgi:hypothetical protein
MNLQFPYQELRSSIDWVYKQVETHGTHIPRPLKHGLTPKIFANSKTINLVYGGG